MHWRRFAISEIPLDDQAEFETWLTERWAEKDQLLEHFVETGRFPTGDGNDDQTLGKPVSPGLIETEVKLGHWLEATQVFVVLGILALLARQILY
jgi:lysocardiolipin and lysophospholipid acyltransferase